MINWGLRRNLSGQNSWLSYDLLDQAQLLVDKDQQGIIERALRSQAFRFAVHCPRITNLNSRRPFGSDVSNYSEDHLRMVAALFYDFYWYHSGHAKLGRVEANTKKKQRLFDALSKKSGSDIIQDALHIHNDGLRPLIDGLTTDAMAGYWIGQAKKLKTSAAVIDGYMTAGTAITKGGRSPYGLSIMIEALVAEKLIDRKARTAEQYFAEMEDGAVLHYLMHTNGVMDYLGPVDPTADNFTIKCMDSMIKPDDALKIFVANNVVARYLNKYFGFQFTIFPVSYLRDHYFSKEFKQNPTLAERIKSISGHTT
jgi:hypothetical protein